MTKHKYSVYGVSCVGGSLFTGTCVADDIIKAIETYRELELERGDADDLDL